MKKGIGRIIFVSFLGMLPSVARGSEDLIITSMYSDPTAKKAFTAVIDGFKAQFPNVNVTINTVDHESYKVQIRTWLPSNPPDIATWFVGNRASYFVERGLVEPIDDVWRDEGANFNKAAENSIRFNGRAYLMPTTYYQWGFYYRKDLFAKAGISTPPGNWQDFKIAIQKLKSLGITPVTIGTRQGWPAAAWFDYLNLRINGIDFYRRLLRGEESYLDPRVKRVMAEWRSIIELGAFSRTAPALTWQEASASLWLGRSAMYLMGNFIATEIPTDLKDQIGYFPFPIIDPAIPMAEVAPMDVYFIPAKAKHKDTAKKFIRYLAKAETQGVLNQISRLLPTNTKTPLHNPDMYQLAGQKQLQEASDLLHFFDIDAAPEVAKVGTDAFVEFMAKSAEADRILAKIEKARLRVHKR